VCSRSHRGKRKRGSNWGRNRQNIWQIVILIGSNKFEHFQKHRYTYMCLDIYAQKASGKERKKERRKEGKKERKVLNVSKVNNQKHTPRGGCRHLHQLIIKTLLLVGTTFIWLVTRRRPGGRQAGAFSSVRSRVHACVSKLHLGKVIYNNNTASHGTGRGGA